MKKLKIGEKEFEIDEHKIQQLTDDDLEDACGGASTGGKTYCRLVCDSCSFKSWWGIRSAAEKDFLNHFHRQQGCGSLLRRECQYFDSDPNQMTD